MYCDIDRNEYYNIFKIFGGECDINKCKEIRRFYRNRERKPIFDQDELKSEIPDIDAKHTTTNI